MQPELSIRKLLAILMERHPDIVRKGHRTSLFDKVKVWRRQRLEELYQAEQPNAILVLDSAPPVIPITVSR